MFLARIFRFRASACTLYPASCILLLCLALAGCAKKQANQLVIGMELSYPPFEMTDEHNQPSGIGVEMGHALAVYLHKDLVVQNTAFVGLIPALNTGKIDLIISSMTANDERRQAIDFSDPYLHTGISLLLGNRSNAQSVDDLNQPGRKIAVKNATTGYLYARDHLPKAEIVQLADMAACVLEVVQGKCDAFIYDQMSVYQLHNKNPDTTRAILAPIQREDWAIGVRKGNDALREQVNAFIKDYKEKHGLETLGDKYIHDKEAFKEMGYPFS